MHRVRTAYTIIHACMPVTALRVCSLAAEILSSTSTSDRRFTSQLFHETSQLLGGPNVIPNVISPVHAVLLGWQAAVDVRSVCRRQCKHRLGIAPHGGASVVEPLEPLFPKNPKTLSSLNPKASPGSICICVIWEWRGRRDRSGASSPETSRRGTARTARRAPSWAPGPPPRAAGTPPPAPPSRTGRPAARLRTCVCIRCQRVRRWHAEPRPLQAVN